MFIVIKKSYQLAQINQKMFNKINNIIYINFGVKSLPI
jgi:hypothetical protein